MGSVELQTIARSPHEGFASRTTSLTAWAGVAFESIDKLGIGLRCLFFFLFPPELGGLLVSLVL
jgi:hypothetical protein